jgi:hypothetical protein
MDQQQRNYTTPPIQSKAQYQSTPQPQAPYYHQQANSGPPQSQTQQQQYTQPQQLQAQPPNQARQSRPSSFMGGNMMNKMSSKFTQFQTSTKSGPLASTHPASKAPSSGGNDWKKWGKRAAIGVAAVGALALGVDAMDGGIFDGAAAAGGGDFSGGGGDFSGGGYEGMDPQTAVDASAIQADIALQGQENALMLADPPGTTCEYFRFPA